MNAKEEYLEFIINKPPVKCVLIKERDDNYDEVVKAMLQIGYTVAHLNEFLKKIDYIYDSGYGSQELFGIIWFNDGSWADRGEYDGSEWWEYQKCPKIPTELT